jgi:hypothetical protein
MSFSATISLRSTKLDEATFARWFELLRTQGWVFRDKYGFGSVVTEYANETHTWTPVDLTELDDDVILSRLRTAHAEIGRWGWLMCWNDGSAAVSVVVDQQNIEIDLQGARLIAPNVPDFSFYLINIAQPINSVGLTIYSTTCVADR